MREKQEKKVAERKRKKRERWVSRNLISVAADDVSSISLNQNNGETGAVRHRKLPLRKLMFEERETGSSSSSTSEAEDIDLDGVAPGTYCVRDPKSSSASWKRPCKKSSSMGSSSKRWKFRDILPRSHSDLPILRRLKKLQSEENVWWPVGNE